MKVKKRILLLVTVALVGLAGMVNAQDQKKVEPVNPVGKWDFTAPDAPYGYEKGQIVITKGEKEFKVKIVFNEYAQTDGYKVKYKHNKLTFTAYVEDESVYLSGTFVKDSFTGKASTSQGDIGLKATRKKEVKNKKRNNQFLHEKISIYPNLKPI